MAGLLRTDAAIPAGATSVAAVAWRFRGTLRVTAIAKASFAFALEAPAVRVDPQEIVRDEIHHGDHPGRSVRLTTDLIPYLPRAESLFTGHAHAPDGRPVEVLPVRLGIFDGARALVDKTVLVRQKGGFQKVPLVYERAYGGIGWMDNPYGSGFNPGSGEPSLFDPARADRVVCFAPMSRSWPARKKRLGGMSPRALQGPIAEIPDDLDWEYFHAAPPDQRLDALRGDEWIVMDGVHPEIPRLRTRLPGARGLARIHGLSSFGIEEGQPLELHADMLRIDGDEQRCTLTFRGAFTVPGEAALGSLRLVAGVETQGEPIVWPDAAALLGPQAGPARATPARAFDGTMALDDDEIVVVAGGDATLVIDEAAVPRVAPEGGGPAQLTGTVALDPAALAPAAANPPFAGTVALADGTPPASAVLPFREGAAPAAVAMAAPASTPRAPASYSGTVSQTPNEVARAARRAALPFGAPEPAQASPGPLPLPIPLPLPLPLPLPDVPEIGSGSGSGSGRTERAEANARPAQASPTPPVVAAPAPPPPRPKPPPPQPAGPAAALTSVKKGGYDRFKR